MGSEAVFFILVALALQGVLGAFVAEQKHRGSGEGFFLGFFLGLFGVLVEALLPARVPNQ